MVLFSLNLNFQENWNQIYQLNRLAIPIINSLKEKRTVSWSFDVSDLFIWFCSITCKFTIYYMYIKASIQNSCIHTNTYTSIPNIQFEIEPTFCVYLGNISNSTRLCGAKAMTSLYLEVSIWLKVGLLECVHVRFYECVYGRACLNVYPYLLTSDILGLHGFLCV